ncbi:myelin transcription factor 1-like protein [Metopolophium dirhodum]|uniref:myelin transcription factor 1-like protein n=1 Tax=Metopolophium dirhodum TaxID=44670 RepID=UPI00298F8219|nr:myelin transcription factor 1-like protein [Metopolophium dirhodum]
MDQEGNNGRRRSSRLAARGIVTTPKAEIIVKKTVKSSEKPKRSKRKTTEETIELPEAKKTKTEDKTSSDEIGNPEENETNNVDENDVSGISPMDVDNVEETNVSPPSDVEKKDLKTVEEKTDVLLEDSKDQEAVEKLPVTKDDKDKDNKSVDETEDEKSETTEELIKVKDSEITEQPNNDTSQDEAKPGSVALENTNGKSEEKEKIESVEDIVNDIGFCVATKDVVTPNGDTDEQVKSNGDESTTEIEAKEPIKALHDDTNHVEEKDLKAVTATTAITTNNDAPIVDQVEKELDNVVDNNISASADDNAPKVDQLSTVVS